MKALFRRVSPFLSSVPKARAAKIVRSFVETATTSSGGANYAVQEELCEEALAWCSREERTFLRHRVVAKLALLQHQQGRNMRALELIDGVQGEVKRLDDKLLLVEIFLLGAQINFARRHLPKAKAALTAARSNANAVHCPLLLQSEIDILAGAIHLDDQDPKTAFSYFYEALEVLGSNPQMHSRAQLVVKYLMLSKILQGEPKEAVSLLNTKHFVRFLGPDTAAMREVAESCVERSLAKFELALERHSSELAKDPVIERHTKNLYQTLLSDNLRKVLEPFSSVELTHVAELMKLPTDVVQNKLCEMILDKELDASLDQKAGKVTLFPEQPTTSIYADGGAIMDSLIGVAQTLSVCAERVI